MKLGLSWKHISLWVSISFTICWGFHNINLLNEIHSTKINFALSLLVVAAWLITIILWVWTSKDSLQTCIKVTFSLALCGMLGSIMSHSLVGLILYCSVIGVPMMLWRECIFFGYISLYGILAISGWICYMIKNQKAHKR